ncbi:MAG: hypothetical protein HZB87_07705 [Desulfatitalea sp.]|nr:hypothetical protein [Desulfatitalea sp.]
MGQTSRIAPFIVLVVVFIVLQPVLVVLDCRQTPASVAKQFVQDYYYLDADMEKWLCESVVETQWVDGYLQSKTDEAAQRGLSAKNLRRKFTHMHVETVAAQDDSAVVQIKGTLRTAIYPAFMLVGKMFGIGQNYDVDTTVHLTKENGRWRVCNQL